MFIIFYSIQWFKEIFTYAPALPLGPVQVDHTGGVQHDSLSQTIRVLGDLLTRYVIFPIPSSSSRVGFFISNQNNRHRPTEQQMGRGSCGTRGLNRQRNRQSRILTRNKPKRMGSVKVYDMTSCWMKTSSSSSWSSLSLSRRISSDFLLFDRVEFTLNNYVYNCFNSGNNYFSYSKEKWTKKYEDCCMCVCGAYGFTRSSDENEEWF